jgi:hypothetical protein
VEEKKDDRKAFAQGLHTIYEILHEHLSRMMGTSSLRGLRSEKRSEGDLGRKGIALLIGVAAHQTSGVGIQVPNTRVGHLAQVDSMKESARMVGEVHSQRKTCIATTTSGLASNISSVVDLVLVNRRRTSEALVHRWQNFHRIQYASPVRTSIGSEALDCLETTFTWPGNNALDGSCSSFLICELCLTFLAPESREEVDLRSRAYLKLNDVLISKISCAHCKSQTSVDNFRDLNVSQFGRDVMQGGQPLESELSKI